MFRNTTRSTTKGLLAIAFTVAAIFTAGTAQAAINYQTDFESPTAMSDDGWYAFVNYFSADCSTYESSPYGFPAPDNGPQVSALVPGASSQVLNAYSNYDDVAQQTNCLETNIYLQLPILAEDVGEYVFSYDVELPAAEFVGDKVNGFVKVFSGDFSATLLAVTEPSTAGSKQVAVTITDAMVGGVLQFGFNNYAHNYEPSGMLYDNVAFTAQQEPPVPPPSVDPVPSDVPTLSPLGLLALLLLVGATAGIVLVRRS